MGRILIVTLGFPQFFYLPKMSWSPRIWVWKDDGDVCHLNKQGLLEDCVDRTLTDCSSPGSPLSLALVSISAAELACLPYPSFCTGDLGSSPDSATDLANGPGPQFPCL